mgnify:CR=1 FL=1
MGVVHQQQGAVLVAYLGQSGDLRHAAQIVRAGEVHRRRRLRQAVQGLLQLGGGRWGTRTKSGFLRPQPADFQIQQSGGGDKGPVDIPRRHHGVGAAGRHRQVQQDPPGPGRQLSAGNPLGEQGPHPATQGGGGELDRREDEDIPALGELGHRHNVAGKEKAAAQRQRIPHGKGQPSVPGHKADARHAQRRSQHIEAVRPRPVHRPVEKRYDDAVYRSKKKHFSPA